MPHLLQARGEAALAAVLRRRPLLGFDFDGTLAPIVRKPELARVSPAVAGRLGRVAARLPVAVVSGRSAADLQERLQFRPSYLVGNHGAEMAPGEASTQAQALDPLRGLLAAQEAQLRALGITVEDKGLSIALHFRLSREPRQAQAWIQELLRAAPCPCRTFGGKMVENVVPADAPDKSGAMQALVRASGASCAVFVGDDVNDEPVFASAPEDWLTVRIGRDDPRSAADFFLDHPGELALVLDRVLALLGSRAMQAGH